MTKEELASRLNGREYRSEITRDEAKEAAINGLIVIYGYSDDNVEFDGALRDEVGCFGSVKIQVARVGGKLSLVEPHDDDAAYIKRGWSPPTVAFSVNAEWCPEGFEGGWRITPSVPFASFDIMEDGGLFCRGAVIDERDLPA